MTREDMETMRPASTSPALTRGSRFHAFPTRQTFIDGQWVTGVTYRVTSVRRYPEDVHIFWRLDDDGTGAQAHASLAYLQRHGLEVLS